MPASLPDDDEAPPAMSLAARITALGWKLALEELKARVERTAATAARK